MTLLKKLAGGLALLIALFTISGCETTGTNPFGGGVGPRGGGVKPEALSTGDLVIVNFSGIEMAPQPHEERIKEDGTITLPYIGSVVASGKTPGELQKEIRKEYVPKYFTESLNVIVKGQDRFVFVGGEVRSSGRYPYTEGLTVLKAIQTAGGFTDFAKRTKVRLVRRDGKKSTVNCDKAQDRPELDLPVYPDDQITVPRKVW